jgi:hypothetical protein
MSVMQLSGPIQESPERTPVLPLFAVSAAMLTALLALVITLFMGPKFIEISKDFGMQLSPTTMQFFRLTTWLTGTTAPATFPAWPLVLVALSITTAGLYRMCFLPRQRAAAIIIALAILLFTLLYLLIAFVSVFTQLTTMINSLQGNP